MEDNGSSSDPLVVCPSEAELQAEPTVNVSCTVEGCSKIFNTSAARNIHIIQTHKIYKDDDERKRFNRSQNKNISKVIKHFYCPVKMCNRSEDWKKPFSRLSLLKQHYYTLHAEKKYPCQKCEKRFSTQSQHATHQRDCGKEFFCTCGEKHNSVTSLYMHAKRKQHTLPDQYNKRKKPAEPVKERYILVVPVPCGDPRDIQKAIREPVPLLPHLSSCTFLPVSGTGQLMSNLAPTNTSIPATVTMPGLGGAAAVGVGSAVKMESHVSATTSTQTDESVVIPLSPKLATSSSYAQTAHSCFPSFIPMINGPRRHKKTLAIQTHAQWTQGQHLSKMASTETQTLGGQNNTEQGNAGQGQTSLGTPSTISTRLPSLDQSISGPFFHQFPNPVSLSGPQTPPSLSVIASRSNSTVYDYGVNSAQISSSSRSVPQNSQLDTNSTQTPWNVIAIGNNHSANSTRPSMDPTCRNKILSPNEVLTQTDLTFQNFMEYNTSETQTLSSFIDAMTDTNESLATTAVEARTRSTPVVPSVSPAPLGLSVQTNATTMSPATSLGVQTSATSMPPAPFGLGVQPNATSVTPTPLGLGVETKATSMTSAPLDLGVQTSSTSMSPRPLGFAVQTNATSITPAPLGVGVQTNATSMSSAPLELGVQTNATSMTPVSLGVGVQTNATSMSSAPLELGVQTNATSMPSASSSMSSAPLELGVQTNATSISSAPLRLFVQTNATSMTPTPLGVGIQTNATNMSPAPMGLGVQTNATNMSPSPLGLGVQTSSTSMSPSPLGLGFQTSGTSISPALLGVGNQNSDMSMPPAPQDLQNQSSTTSMSPAPDIAMSGLDLLFLASTEHRASTSPGLPRMDETLCCQQTQTVFDTDTGHQETQTAWDWSLDEFSFLDQYTQTALSASSSTSSTTTTMPETDQFCQTGLDLYSPFAFSNTETQTVSVFDLEMFGNSISVQTEARSASKLLGGDGPSELSKEVQVSSIGTQQERVSADVQTEDMDFNRVRSRQMGTSQLASSHTQTSLWEDIESIIRSDSFTQTQFPQQINE